MIILRLAGLVAPFPSEGAAVPRRQTTRLSHTGQMGAGVEDIHHPFPNNWHPGKAGQLDLPVFEQPLHR